MIGVTSIAGNAQSACTLLNFLPLSSFTRFNPTDERRLTTCRNARLIAGISGSHKAFKRGQERGFKNENKYSRQGRNSEAI